MANVAFGLILFEFGYRINLRWLRTNPWIGITGLLESGLSFIVVFAIAQWYGALTSPHYCLLPWRCPPLRPGFCASSTNSAAQVR
jgi:hypothetical protein